MVPDARLKNLILLGYLPTPHCLSRCSWPRHTPNFTAIGASNRPDSGRHSSFKSFRSRKRGVIFPFFHDFPPPRARPINIICTEPVTFSLLTIHHTWYSVLARATRTCSLYSLPTWWLVTQSIISWPEVFKTIEISSPTVVDSIQLTPVTVISEFLHQCHDGHYCHIISNNPNAITSMSTSSIQLYFTEWSTIRMIWIKDRVSWWISDRVATKQPSTIDLPSRVLPVMPRNHGQKEFLIKAPFTGRIEKEKGCSEPWRASFQYYNRKIKSVSRLDAQRGPYWVQRNPQVRNHIIHPRTLQLVYSNISESYEFYKVIKKNKNQKTKKWVRKRRRKGKGGKGKECQAMFVCTAKTVRTFVDIASSW